MRASNSFGVHFIIKTSKLIDGKAPIFARIVVESRRVEISMKQRVMPSQWRKFKGMGRGTRQEILDLNAYLEQVRAAIISDYQDLQVRKKRITPELLKSRYLGEEEKEHTLNKLVEYHNTEFKGANNELSYREMFIAKTPYADETILAVALDASLQVFSSANRRFISPTYGSRPSLTRGFVNTYLNLDGTPFTSDAGYQNTPFVDEVKNRDLRLKQTVRLGDYHRTENGVSVVAPPNFTQTFTGYQPIKWCYDERFPYDDESRNDNAHIIMRFAEVLLNKAEALAELGAMTPGDWSETIGALRERAGITGSTLTTVPSEADPYLVDYYLGKFTDPILLEVIRERAVEMVFEGLRPDDLRRWHIEELFEQAPMNGMYVPALGEYDLNEDGVMDVYFYQGDRPESSNPAIAFVDVTPS